MGRTPHVPSFRVGHRQNFFLHTNTHAHGARTRHQDRPPPRCPEFRDEQRRHSVTSRSKLPRMAQIREAELPADLDAVQRLWLAYLTWGNDGLEDRYGSRL